MLTALVSALIDFIRVLAEWLVDIALWLEGSPLEVAWPVFLALILQLLVFRTAPPPPRHRGNPVSRRCGWPWPTSARRSRRRRSRR